VPVLNATRAALTVDVAGRLEVMSGAAGMISPPGGTRTGSEVRPSENTIDKYIFQALSEAGVAPAPSTTDFEFIRRVTLDLTGRIPTADAVINFVNDTSADKRSKLVDSLLASSNWVDKWTVWFGDLYQNNSRNTQIPRYVPGVMGFNTFVRTSLQN